MYDHIYTVYLTNDSPAAHGILFELNENPTDKRYVLFTFSLWSH